MSQWLLARHKGRALHRAFLEGRARGEDRAERAAARGFQPLRVRTRALGCAVTC